MNKRSRKFLKEIGFQGDLLPELWPAVKEMKAIGKRSPAYKQFPMILATVNDNQRRINQMGVTLKAIKSRLDLVIRMKSNGRY